jgi:drug/metabolite transporter (DMT)-like permease
MTLGEQASQKTTPTWRPSGTIAIVIACFFLAGMAVLARTLNGRVPSAQVVLLRHAVGVLGIGLFFLLRKRRPLMVRRRLLILRGVLGGATVLTYFHAIEHLGAAPATVLNYVGPVYAAAFATLFLGERQTKRTIAGLTLGTLGSISVALASASGSGTGSLLGAMSGLVSGVLAGAAMATVKAVREEVDAGTIFLAFSVVGGLMSLPFAMADWVPLSLGDATVVLTVGALALIGQTIYTWGMGYTSATSGSATTQLVPILSWVLAVTLLQEPVVPLSAFGALLCVLGVVVGRTMTADERSTIEEIRRGA